MKPLRQLRWIAVFEIGETTSAGDFDIGVPFGAALIKSILGQLKEHVDNNHA